ncbi:hypothetical protein [Noviherbaspirillum aridicola]|uniref:Uncharacterized protein n=1 Tax=Noviherbaspirillum aridicola TaxID=2849687 RepID=A0ABQ4Q2X3_9BURK|nr:hypothetical protein [Noviherbaspirillum aridicola]GIZ51381.1 hypothetical protein NCCP691_13950 [Noviherbaspirillum aridicola]
MSQPDSQAINRLVGEFMDLQEAWENDPNGFDWRKLDEIVQQGAQAYNEGNGPSFHSLALDGVRHSIFHERFLSALMAAGFDPFRLASAGSDSEPIPVIDHAVLAESAETNASSARMRDALMERARSLFEPLAQEAEAGRDPRAHPLFAPLRACAESVPDDLMHRIAPELAGGGGRSVHGMKEGYLTQAEAQIEHQRRPMG